MRRGHLQIAILVQVFGIFRSSPCGKGTFECKDVQECIDEELVCNKMTDCKDGTDEVFCQDRHQDEIWDLRYQKRPDADREFQDKTCGLHDVPKACECRESTHIYCNNANLGILPSDIPHETIVLDVSGNDIIEIPLGYFHSLHSLKRLYIGHNGLTAIQNNSFQQCIKLEHLNLVDNKIYSIDGPMFSKQNSLAELNLDYNSLNRLTADVFKHLLNLDSLYLRNNEIAFIEDGTFSVTPNLRILFLTGNRLSRINAGILQPLTKLSHLHIGNNRIKDIEPASFHTQHALVSLTLSQNRLRALQRETLSGLYNMTFLDLQHNMLVDVQEEAFHTSLNLKSLDLRVNPLKRLPMNTLKELHHLEFVYFDNFYMCIYATHVEHCEPYGNGISSQQNLLENAFLRIMVWVVALLSLFGNLMVIFGRIILREDNQVHSFYIKNLSLADMLMGVYLFILGVRDMMYKGTYLYHDKNWRQSYECDFCGVLSAVSSEVSVMTLAIITFDRYKCIMYPLYGKRKNVKPAYLIMLVIWTCSLLISILPITGIPYFGNMFYRDNSVCIPLHLHNPKVQGWEYSTFLFLGITMTAFSFMCYAYAAMYVTIHKSTENLRSHFDSKERSLAQRFFLIVLTDFMCWAPIMIFKLIAISGTPVHGDLYAWLVIFVLPINSAINPLLYTLTTKLFREKVIPRICCGLHIVRIRSPVIRESSSSSSSGSRRCGARIRNCLERDLYEVGVHTLRCASLNYSSKKYQRGQKLVQMDSYQRRQMNKDYLCFNTREAFSAVDNRSQTRENAVYFPLVSSQCVQTTEKQRHSAFPCRSSV